MIHVVNRLGPGDDAGARVERRTDRVARLLLPVLGPRRAGARAHTARRGERQRAKGRGVGDLRLERERGDGQQCEHTMLLLTALSVVGLQ